jgi:hypothetical protein
VSTHLRHQFGDLGAQSGSANQLGERGNLLGPREAVLQLGPEREPQVATGFLQTEQGVASAAPELPAGARADFAGLDVLPKLSFAPVVVPRDFRPVQPQHQFGLVLLESLEGQLQGLKAGFGREKGLNPPCQLPLLRRTRGLRVRFEVLLPLPALPPAGRSRFPLRRTEREQFVDRALGMPPTPSRTSDVKWARILPKHPPVGGHLMTEDPAQ